MPPMGSFPPRGCALVLVQATRHSSNRKDSPQVARARSGLEQAPLEVKAHCLCKPSIFHLVFQRYARHRRGFSRSRRLVVCTAAARRSNGRHGMMAAAAIFLHWAWPTRGHARRPQVEAAVWFKTRFADSAGTVQLLIGATSTSHDLKHGRVAAALERAPRPWLQTRVDGRAAARLQLDRYDGPEALGREDQRSALGDELHIVGVEKVEECWVLQEWNCAIPPSNRRPDWEKAPGANARAMVKGKSRRRLRVRRAWWARSRSVH